MMNQNKYRRIASKKSFLVSQEDKFWSIQLYFRTHKHTEVTFYVSGYFVIDEKAYELATGKTNTVKKIHDIFEYLDSQSQS